MKCYQALIVSLFVLLGCSPKKEGKKFFTYDKIEHYNIQLTDDEIKTIDLNKRKSVLDSLKNEALMGIIPKSLNDSLLMTKLVDIGFKKINIRKKYFKSIDSLFVEKEVDHVDSLACDYLYRDIMVFRKKGKITGVTRICFECGMNHIVGTTANTVNFGQNGDYFKLEQLLKTNMTEQQ